MLSITFFLVCKLWTSRRTTKSYFTTRYATPKSPNEVRRIHRGLGRLVSKARDETLSQGVQGNIQWTQSEDRGTCRKVEFEDEWQAYGYPESNQCFELRKL